MRFKWAKAHHFRLLKDERFELHPRFNYFFGGNGAGKTTVLEALHALGRAGSHRSPAQSLIADGQNAWSLDAALNADDESVPGNLVKVRWAERRVHVEINGQSASLTELVRLVPVLVLDPLSHRIMDEGPGIRRRYVDWGVFHMEQSFHSSWTRMNRALKQRNAGLRSYMSDRELAGWNRELVAAGLEVNELRLRYVQRLETVAEYYWTPLLGQSQWTLRFQRGWNATMDFAEVLDRNFESDRKLGYTREGPHRAELQILGDNTQLKNRISRGQQKLLVSSLILAQGEIYRQQHGESPVLLLDDFAAELSQDSQSKLLDELEAYSGQKVIAVLDNADVLKRVGDHFMFHVEHGHITKMN